MELTGLKVSIVGDVSKLQKALTDAGAYVSAFSKYAKDAFSGINIDTSGFAKAGQAQRDAAAAARDYARAAYDSARADDVASRTAERKVNATKSVSVGYKQLSAEYRDALNAYKDLAVAELKAGGSLENMSGNLLEAQKRVMSLNDQLKKIDAGAGNFQRNVGNYSSAFNPLQNSITQLTREMPAFANSMQTGFMAISNNIPALTDALAGLKARNAELVAQGQPAQSAFKAIAGAIFSWQTAISVGITLLTVYGPKLVEMITNTEGAAEAQKKLKKAQEEAAQIQQNANRQAADQISRLKVLQSLLQSETTSMVQKNAALKELQSTYPSYLGNLDMAKVKNGELANIINTQLIPAIRAASKAQAAMSIMQKNDLANIEDGIKQEKLLAELRMKQEAQIARQSAITKRRNDPFQPQTLNAGGTTSQLEFDQRRGEEAITALQRQNTALIRGIRQRESENQKLTQTYIAQSAAMGSLDATGKDVANGYMKQGKAAKDAKEKVSELQQALETLRQAQEETSTKFAQGMIDNVQRIEELKKAYEAFIIDATSGKGNVGMDHSEVVAARAELEKLKQAINNIDISNAAKAINMPETDVLKQVLGLNKAIQIPANVQVRIAPMTEDLNRIAQEMKELGKAIGTEVERFAEDMVSGIGESLGDMLSGDAGLGTMLERIAGALGSFMQQVGKMLIQAGIQMGALKKALSVLNIQPLAAVGIGVAMVALGRAARNSINKQQVRLASGGIAYGPTDALIGEYPGARYNPEVVAPLNKLQGMITKTIQNSPIGVKDDGYLAVTEIDLDKLRVAIKRIEKNALT